MRCHATHASALLRSQASSIVFHPENYEQHGSCTQPGPDGLIGSFGAGIPFEFARPAGMPVREFNMLLGSGNLHELCAKADILPETGVSLPKGMAEAQFERANRDGTLQLSPCAAPHMPW